jgi:hypothetical protein
MNIACFARALSFIVTSQENGIIAGERLFLMNFIDRGGELLSF